MPLSDLPIWDPSAKTRTAQPKPAKFTREKDQHKRRVGRASEKRTAAKRDLHEWALKRAEIMSRDRGVCRVCGQAVKVQTPNPAIRAEVHHIVYRSAGGSDASRNLVLLCGECHYLEHQHRIEIAGDGDRAVRITTRDEAGTVIRQYDSPCPASCGISEARR